MTKRSGFLTLFVGNFLSKGIGFLREILFSAWFGTGETATAFRIAQTAYLLPVQALVGDTLSAGMVPLYKKLNNDENMHQVLMLCATIYALLLSFLITVSLYLFANNIASFIAPGASNNIITVASFFIKILALATPFYIVGGMLSFIETTYGFFAGVAYRPILLNFFSILGATLAVYFKIDHWLVTTILISHIIFFLISLLGLMRIDKIYPSQIPKLLLVKDTTLSFFKNIIPLLALPLLAQMNVLIERIVSSWIGASIIPAVDYARFLCDTTVQLLAVPLGIVTMAKFGGTKSIEFDKYIENTFSLLILVSFPLALFCFQNSSSIIKIIYERGAFDYQSVMITSQVFKWMSLALCFTITSYFLIKVLNSKLKNNVSLIFTFLAVAVNMALNIIFWESIGVGIIGMSILGYSTTLFLLCIFYLKLIKKFFILLLFISPFLFLQFIINYLFNTWFKYNDLIYELLFYLVIMFFWIFIYSIFPKSREIFKPMIGKVLIKRGGS